MPSARLVATLNQVVGTLAQLIVAVGGQAAIEGVTQGTVGGKNVYIVANDDGTKGYGYVSGDTLVTVDDATQFTGRKDLRGPAVARLRSDNESGATLRSRRSSHSSRPAIPRGRSRVLRPGSPHRT